VRPLAGLWRAFCALLLVVVLGFALVQCWFFLHVLYWKRWDPNTTSFMDTRLAQLRERDPKAQLQYHWVDYPRISMQAKRAIIAAEDMKFIDHEGFDWDGIQHALAKNQKKGKPVAGGSTITQQLAKNLFLSGERTYWRKGEEALITLMLEAVLDKRRILELYLNVVEWGVGVFGVDAAAHHYYGIPAANLGPEQAARLAAMLPRPQFYDKNRGSAYLAGYAERILGRMGDSQVP
jgi:monofunctional biosynthetic peptidoglycan transglycosylase